VLAIVAQQVDDAMKDDAKAWYLVAGGPAGARAILSTIASSMMTFTGVVFSVTVLVLQLASSQFSPRVLRTFLKDRASQLALGTFVGTFVFAMLGLRNTIGTGPGTDLSVPTFTVWVSMVLALACVLTFIAFIHHIAQSIRAIVVIRRIGDETRASMDRLYPESVGEGVVDEDPPVLESPVTLQVAHAGASGVLARVHSDLLESVARDGRVALTLTVRPGDFIAHGAPLFDVRGDASQVDIDALAASVVTRSERDVDDDIAFGIRELVDIAERALSPGVNDPSTAVQVIDELHDLLRRLARRRFPSPVRETENGEVVLVLPRAGFDDLVRLAIEEIRQYGAGSVQVLRRLRGLIDDVSSVAPPGRTKELDAQRSLLDAAVSRALPDARDQALAGIATFGRREPAT
jgi:uncharacterized membrane protein